MARKFRGLEDACIPFPGHLGGWGGESHLPFLMVLLVIICVFILMSKHVSLG